MSRQISRGDIYYSQLGDNFGHEQGGVRPVLIIQNNIGNQIAARANSTGIIYIDDIEEIKKKQEEIWQLQKSILSNLR